MTHNGPFATVDDDDSFNGNFDEWENEVIIEAYAPDSELRLTCKAKVERCEPLDDGHVLTAVLDENGVGGEDFHDFHDVSFRSRLIVTTDGFDRATRAHDPITREGRTDIIGRDAEVYTTREWAEYMTGLAESKAEADLDRRRERHFDEHGH